MRLALEVAEHDRQAKLLRQPRDLLVQRAAPIFVTRSLFARNKGRQVIHLAHQGILPRAVETRLDGNPMRDAMQPAPDRIPRQIVPALRIRTRNVAWNASSTSGESFKTVRQTARTIGPCRPTSAANAPSSRVDRNLSMSWPSVKPATVPASNNR